MHGQQWQVNEWFEWELILIYLNRGKKIKWGWCYTWVRNRKGRGFVDFFRGLVLHTDTASFVWLLVWWKQQRYLRTIVKQPTSFWSMQDKWCSANQFSCEHCCQSRGIHLHVGLTLDVSNLLFWCILQILTLGSFCLQEGNKSACEDVTFQVNTLTVKATIFEHT